MKLKTCKICKLPFEPKNSLQVVCLENGFKCAIEHANIKRDKKVAKDKLNAARELKQAKEAIKPLKYWADKAQKVFNQWIVKRDGRVCISCGTIKPDIQYCAGHYRTRKAASQLRYNEDNVHTQCNNYCNLKNSGNIENYRPALIAKIGQERHDALINNNEIKRWTKEECKEIERKYKKLLKLC
jgi:hypothetical protein